jgi:hypothetical protein
MHFNFTIIDPEDNKVAFRGPKADTEQDKKTLSKQFAIQLMRLLNSAQPQDHNSFPSW